ncbi:hypothetical protein CLAFUW4_06542 [Fulvia fulva]|nr:hypothetical protein CLAFUR4_06550 [Fulvia fulva]KAK4623333.1 hypothetical protein CLAFUR0_06546 [Fulvia fulva]WPV16262.1 hypothetical protein CLAFUW4_06542 [Fulvia fulva]WPV31266.1 hypothetical protein CLAFUW7_06541 [Fulvia fulva]
MGVRLNDLTLRIKYDEEGDRSKALVLFCVNLPQSDGHYPALRRELGQMFRKAVGKIMKEEEKKKKKKKKRESGCLGESGFLGEPELLRSMLAEQLKKSVKGKRLTIKVKASQVALDEGEMGRLVVPQPGWADCGKFSFRKMMSGWLRKLF